MFAKPAFAGYIPGVREGALGKHRTALQCRELYRMHMPSPEWMWRKGRMGRCLIGLALILLPGPGTDRTAIAKDWMPGRLHAPVYASPPDGDFGSGENFLEMPAVGAHRLRILAPTVLELSLVTTKPPNGRVEAWDFVAEDSTLHLPKVATFRVLVNGREKRVKAV